ncbi:MAG: ATPase [Anaerolineae bacterium]|nr:ATPase [Anaerolineae bacterium]
MSQYFLGIDIGATKSHALIADAQGRAVGFGEYGPGSHEIIGYDGLRAALHTITDAALASASLAKADIAGAGFGIAGYDWPGDAAPHHEVIALLGLSVPYALVNDTIIGLVAGATEGWGVGVVSGTGSNCWGRDRQGRGARQTGEGRMTGGGGMFAEYAGGGDLVAKAVQAVALAWGRRGPETRLTEAFLALTGAADALDLLEGLYRGHYTLSSANAPLVFQIASEGDAVAQEVIHWAGRELGSLAIGVIRQLGFEALEFEVVQIGSLYNGSPAMSETMLATIHEVAPGARAVRLTAPPVVGGVLLGMEQAGLEYPPLRQILIESTAALLH